MWFFWLKSISSSSSRRSRKTRETSPALATAPERRCISSSRWVLRSTTKNSSARLDYWWDLEIHYYESLGEFMNTHGDKPLCFFTTKSDYLYTERDFAKGEAWLVFGKESKGLPEDLLLANEDRTARIPMRFEKRSLNLSNSVAVAVFEVLRQRGFRELQTEGERLKLLNSILSE